jgi:tetrahydromethanopterin S-methyltransferase subunit G
MLNKEEKDQPSIIWLEIDFSSVRRRIQEINSQIELILFKHQTQIPDNFHDKAGSEEDNS